jgi:hypothetical protein
MKKLFRMVAILVIGIMMIPMTSVFALANPDSITTSSVVVFTDILGTGDQVVFVRYDVNYTVEPTENASDTFMMAIYDTDGTTLLYTRPLIYYQHNVFSIYLTSAQALTAGGAYTVRIMGNPAVFDSLIENTNMESWVLTPGDYQEGSLMGEFLLGQAQILEDDWVITLLTASNKLNATGSLTFKTAIPGLSDMTPEIFSTTAINPTMSNNSFNNSYGINVSQRIGTMNAAFIDIGDWLGVSQTWAQVLVSGIGAFITASVIFAATRKPEMGVVGAGISVVVFGWMGWFPLQALMIGLAVIAIVFGIIFIMARIG